MTNKTSQLPAGYNQSWETQNLILISNMAKLPKYGPGTILKKN